MSTKNTPEIVLATEDQVDHIATLCDKAVRSAVRAFPRDTAQRAITNRGLLQRHVDQMIENFFADKFEEFLIEIDPQVSIEEWVKRGNYNDVDGRITRENFELTKSGKRRIVLHDPNGDVSAEEMIRRMKEDGFVPATLEDALVMSSKKYWYCQRNYTIVFLGTVWQDPDGNRNVPFISRWDDYRKLGLSRWFESGLDLWGAHCRFAAVREP